MKRVITSVLLSFLLTIMLSGCDITKLISQDNKSGKGTAGEETGDKASTVFQGDEDLSNEASSVKGFKDLARMKPDIEYKITNNEGYYSIGPVLGHIVNIEWKSPNSIEFRTDNGEKTIISNCEIDEKGIKANAIIEAPPGSIYINNSLRDGRGLIFISLMNENNLYWYKNSELKEYKNIQYYYLSPLHKYAVLFPGDFKTKPLLVDLESDTEISLPLEVDHGWPEFAEGLSFSADEKWLLYEDWSKGELCVYDIKGKKEHLRIGEENYKLLEGVLSPKGNIVAYLKYEGTQEYKKIKEGRDPIGEKLVLFDIEKRKVLKEISGEPLIFSKPVWSPDGKYLAFNMLQMPDEKNSEIKIAGKPKVLNISTGKITKLSENEEGLRYAAAWDEESRKIIVEYKSSEIIREPSIIDLKSGDELNIDMDKYYISRVKKFGTDVYEIIGIDNSKLKQFDKRHNLVLSTDEKYIAFTAAIEGSEYLIIVPK